MSSIASRARKIMQPYGGYLPLSSFTKEQFQDGTKLSEQENIPAVIMDAVVDYLTRHILCKYGDATFNLSTNDGSCSTRSGIEDASTEAYEALKRVRGLDDSSILAACELCKHDVYFRVPLERSKHGADVVFAPDDQTMYNIRTMVQRTVKLLENDDPYIEYGVIFPDSCYTTEVSGGSIDFLTTETIWKVKATTKRLTSPYTMQLLMLYVMSQRAHQARFQNISRLGFFNPRQNIAYTVQVSQIPRVVLQAVEDSVMCY